MTIPGLTDAQTSDSCHWLGLMGSAAMLVWSLVTAVVTFLHNLNLPAGAPLAHEWTPSSALVILVGGLIAGGIWNSKINT